MHDQRLGAAAGPIDPTGWRVVRGPPLFPKQLKWRRALHRAIGWRVGRAVRSVSCLGQLGWAGGVGQRLGMIA